MKAWDSMNSQKRMFLSDPILIHVFGLAEATILCRILYKMIDAEDWVEATHHHIRQMTGISEKVQRRAIGNLKKAGLLEVMENRMHHQTSYRVNRERLNEMEELMLQVAEEWDERDRQEREALLADLTKGKFANRPYPPYLPTGRRRPPNGNLATLPTGSSTLYGTEELKEKEEENVDSDESTPLLEDSDSDSPETEEAPPQESAAPPPPPEGPRRAPRMPPPRPQAPEPPRTRRDADRLLCPTEDGKTLPRKPQEAGGGVSGVGLTAKTVVEAWNEMAEANGLPRAMTVTKGRAKALAARFKDAFWVQLWREAIDEIPKDPFRLGHNDRGWKADIDYFLQPDRVAKLIEQRQTKPATNQPPPTAGRSSKCPHPPGSPEWEKWYLANG